MGLEDESNVVGNLFALNGEESGYNAEDWIQTIEIDEKTFFRVSLAEDDGAIPGSLFACALWNGAVGSSAACVTRRRLGTDECMGWTMRRDSLLSTLRRIRPS